MLSRGVPRFEGVVLSYGLFVLVPAFDGDGFEYSDDIRDPLLRFIAIPRNYIRRAGC